MDGKFFDQFFSILIDPRSNYRYANIDLVDKCVLSKEVHTQYWLLQLYTSTMKRFHHWVRAYAFKLNDFLHQQI